jgi:transcriptional regulator with XRE-family HTH domain
MTDADLIAQARALDAVNPQYDAKRAFNRILGQRIAWSRASLGWEQKQLAEVLGVSQSAMSRIEKGLIAISVYQLDKLSQVLPYFVTLTFSNKLYRLAPGHKVKSK